LAEGVFDEVDLKLRTEEPAGFVEEASKKYRLEPSKISAVGFSNGANGGGGPSVSTAAVFENMAITGRGKEVAWLRTSVATN